jgi:Secretion system C-terminal sorting domain
MNNLFTARMKAFLPSLSVLCLLFLITLGRTQAATTTFTTDTSWRVTNTNFVGWNTNAYILTPAWLVPGGGKAICNQVGVVGANKIWYPTNTPYQTNYFRKRFVLNQLCEVKSVSIEIASDDVCTLYFNGTAIGSGTANTKIFNIPLSLLRCDNVIAVQARDIAAGCWWMAAKVTINSTPISLAASSNSPVTNPLCVGQTLNLFSGTIAGATYLWTGPSGFSSTLQNPTIPSASLASAGTYTVVVTSGKCCQYRATVDVGIRQCSDCMDLIFKEIICKNGVYYLTLCFQNNSSHTANNINLVSSTSGVTYTPNILSPPGGLLPGQTFCTTVVVSGTGATTGALVCLKAMLLEIKNCKPTWFCMTKDDLCFKLPPCPTTTNPCDSVAVNFNPNTVTICLGDSVQLNPLVTPAAGLGYSWSPGTGLSSVIIKNPWAKPTITTTYTLTVYIPGTNCKKDASVTVIVKQCPPPNPCDWKAAVKDTALTICRGTSTALSAYTIPAVVGATYSWTSSPTSTIVNGNTANPTVTPLSSPTIYTVTITTGSGSATTGQLCIKTATVKVYWKDCPPTGQRKAAEEEQMDDILIAPNPTQTIISVQIPNSMNWEKATLINAQGIILNEQDRIDEAKSVKFDVQSHPSGMYIVRVKTDKGFVNKKVIKE